jgi:pentatricopeptide repeat protein
MKAVEKSPDRDDEVNPRVEAFLEILGRVPTGEVEAALSSYDIGPTPDVVEQVLNNGACYSRPKSVVHFLLLVARTVTHTTYVWNLLIDILGKAGMFEPMWDAIKSMKQEGVVDLVSIATFNSIFSSFYARGNIKEATTTFDNRVATASSPAAFNTASTAVRASGQAAAQCEPKSPFPALNRCAELMGFEEGENATWVMKRATPSMGIAMGHRLRQIF